MRKRLPYISVWGLAYLVLIAVGARTGLPTAIFPTLLLLAVPPLFFHLRACRKVMNRLRLAFPDQWAALNRYWMKLELRYFLFDERTFGDEMIAAWKRELRWWMFAGIIAIALFLPTLFLIERLSK